VLPIKKAIYLGNWLGEGPQIVAGFGIASTLGLGVNDFDSFLELVVPKKQNKALLNQDPFKRKNAFVVGLYQVSSKTFKNFYGKGIRRYSINVNTSECPRFLINYLRYFLSRHAFLSKRC
jgi:hypothetical protein